MSDIVQLPKISYEGDAMLSYQGRTVFVIWEEGDEPGFEVYRLFADGTLNTAENWPRPTDLSEALVMAQQFLKIGQWSHAPLLHDPWADVAGTDLDTRSQLETD